MLVEIHMLKNYPATNLNRDDLGSPKTCEFAGVLRGRISSQCLKRTWRRSRVFENEIGKDQFGIRTRGLPRIVRKRLVDKGVQPDMADAIMEVVSGFGNKNAEPNNIPTRVSQIIFYSEEDINSVCQLVEEEFKNCKTPDEVRKYISGEKKKGSKESANIKAIEMWKKMKDAETRGISVDIALFGRMVTSDSIRDVESAIQVAHAVSTNKVIRENDYFTAVDDLLNDDSMEDSGAGMIDYTEYNSCCYYHYVSIDTDLLKENLRNTADGNDVAKKVVKAVVKSMIFTNPSGKQNSFAGNILPSAVLVEMKDTKIPVSYVNAYAEPVKNRAVVEESIQKLVREANEIRDEFGLKPEHSFWFCSGKYSRIETPKYAQECKDVASLLNGIEEGMN